MKTKHVKQLLPLILLTLTTSVYAVDQSPVFVENGEEYNVKQNATITTNDEEIHGLHAKDLGSKINVDSGVYIAATGKYAHAVYAENDGNINIKQNAVINAAGDSSAAVYVYYGGKINIGTDAVITGNGSSALVSKGNNTKINVDSRVHITTNDQYALAVYARDKSNIDIGTDATITTTGNQAYGVYAKRDGNIDVKQNAIINTKGEDAYAVYVRYRGHINIGTDATINTTGKNTYAIFAKYDGNIDVKQNAAITTTGEDAHAVYAYRDGKINIKENATINTTGEGAHAVYAYHGSNIDIEQNAILNTIGYESVGVYAEYGGNVNLGKDAIITTSHNSAHGLSAYGAGEIIADSGAYITTSGSDAYAVYGEDDSNIDIKQNAILNTTGEDAYAVYAEERAKININKNVVINTKGEDAYAVYAYDRGNIKLNGGTIESEHADTIFASDEYAVISGEGKFNIKAGNNSDALLAEAGGKIDLTLNQKSELIGSVHTDDISQTYLTLKENSTWNLTGDSNLTTLTNTNSTIDMTQSGQGNNLLTVGNLSGSNGTIMMDIDTTMTTPTSDKVVVTDEFKNIHYLDLYDMTSHAPIGKDGIGTILATTTNIGDGMFVGKDKEETLYWTHYILGTNIMSNTTDWFLEDITRIYDHTTSIDTIMSAVNYHTWRNENDKLMKRMGELRLNGTESNGIWARIEGNKISRSGAYGFENKYKTYELGYDKTIIQNKNRTRYVGAAFTYTDGTSSYGRGNGDNSSKSLSVYATDIGSKGHYLELVFKVSSMDNDFKVYDTHNQKITGDYTNMGISLSAEYGRKSELKHGWYIEPQGQLTIGRLRGDDYITSNGVHVAQDSINSVVARAGLNIGKQIGTKGVVYAKANLLHEFGGGYDVSMRVGNDRLNTSDSFDDTWFEYGIGAAFRTSSDSSIYLDLERSTGSDYRKDWQWNVGARWMF